MRDRLNSAKSLRECGGLVEAIRASLDWSQAEPLIGAPFFSFVGLALGLWVLVFGMVAMFQAVGGRGGFLYLLISAWSVKSFSPSLDIRRRL